MRLTITYSVIPSFGESSSLHIQIENEDSSSKFWHQFGGLGQDFINEKPWWIDFDRQATEHRMIDGIYTKEIVDTIKSIHIVPYSEFVAGCDGTMFELEFCAGFNSSKFVWWCELPQQWKGLDSLIELLQSLMDKRQGSA
jgi:hypothetical protein